MPDFTDPWLIPYPLADEYGDGSSQIEAMARAVDPLIVSADARITALASRPILIRRRSADVALAAGMRAITFDTVDENNFSAVGLNTPAAGAHPIAGVYPALWRMDCFVSFVATAPVLGDGRVLEVNVWQVNTSTGKRTKVRVFRDAGVETNTTGCFLRASGTILADRATEFDPQASLGGGTFKAGSWISLHRVRGV